MTIANRITTLLTGLTRNQVEAMPPVERQQLADQCRRIATLAEQRPDGASHKSGVLGDLPAGARRTGAQSAA